MQFYCPRATKPLCSSGFPVHDLPSQDSRPNGGYCPAAQSRFGRFLALTVPSAVGLVTHVPLRLYPGEKSSLQRTATRRHRTQLYEILGSFEQFFRKVTYFAKTFQFQPNNSICQPFFRVNNEFKFSTFSGGNLECLAAQGVPRFFAKYVTLRKFLCHFLDRKKDAFRRPFYVIPLRKPIPSTALRL